MITSTHRRTPNRARSGRVLGVSVALALAIAACGGSDSDSSAADATSRDSGAVTTDAPSDSTPATDAPDGSAPSVSETTEPAAQDDIVNGGDAVIGMVFDAFGLEPTTFVGSITDGSIAQALYDPLMRLTPDGIPEPYLAKTVETDDKQNYTITLNEGIEFQDGTPFNAEAVKFNIERHQDPASKSRSITNASHIESITVVDDLTLEIVLKFPWAAFQQILAGNLGLMASPTAAAAGTLNETPVGTGPFTLQERVPGDHTTVVRNPNYWVEGEPHLDSIKFRVMPDDTIRLTSVQNDEIQIAQSPSALTLSEADDTEGLHSTKSADRVSTVHLNDSVTPFDDVRVRRAMAFALDYDAINEVIYKGTASTAHGFISEDSPYYDDTAEYPEYDPDQAVALVEEYEAENGPIAFKFRCYNDPARVQFTELASQMWRSAGMDVETEITDQMGVVIDLLQGNFTAGCFSMGVDTDDPDQMWYAAFSSDSPSNYTKYSNPEMDKALLAGRESADPETRKEAYAVVQQLLANETPLIQYGATPWGWVVRDEIGGAITISSGEFIASQLYFTS